jgi:hypothetical protein
MPIELHASGGAEVVLNFPQQLMRTMVYTCDHVPAQMLKSYGTVRDVMPTAELRGLSPTGPGKTSWTGAEAWRC